MSKKPISFSALRINGGAQNPAVTPVVPELAPTEQAPQVSKPGKTVPVRLTHEQWYEAKEFAMRQDKSLQELFIQGFNALRASKGLPPLSGTGK